MTRPRRLLPNTLSPFGVRVLELVGFDGPSSLQVGERPEQPPSPHEVRVRLRNMALNHLDVFITRGLPKRDLPAILGSDGAGVVDAVGDSVENLHLGDEVVMYPILTCGRCAACLAGPEVHCQKMA